MSRRRYLSTEISIDTAVNRLARSAGDFAVMLYTWMIPHCDDDGIVHGDAEEIILQVIPGRRDKKIEDVTAALAAMQEHGLIEWDEPARRVVFPAASFYKYQTYIKPERRRGAHGEERNNAPEPPQVAEISADHRKTPQNTVSLKHSHSLSHPEKEQPTVAPPTAAQSAHRAMFGALSGMFGRPTPGAEHKRYEAAARDLVKAGAEPTEIPRLCESWAWVNPGTPRVNSLAGQLTVLRNAKPRASPNGHSETVMASLQSIETALATKKERERGRSEFQAGDGGADRRLPARHGADTRIHDGLDEVSRADGRCRVSEEG